MIPAIWEAVQIMGMPAKAKGKYPIRIRFVWDRRDDGAPMRICAMRTAAGELWVSAQTSGGVSDPAQVETGDQPELLETFGLEGL
jgi:hypothetical protein